MSGYALAEYGRVPVNTIDPAIIEIDEGEFLGTAPDGATELMDENGEIFRLDSLYGKPLILLLSYYRCDGVCPVVADDLKRALEGTTGTLAGLGGFERGKDYSVLSLSFDSLDDISKIKMFKKHAGVGDEGWRLAIFKDPEKIQDFTRSLGYKFFWSERDRTFIHPNVLVFLSPEGRVTRYLYGSAMDSSNIKIALAEAGFGKEGRSAKRELSDIFLIACYSYNYKEGRFTPNYPLFIASGSLVAGFGFTIFGIVYFKRKKRRR